MLAPDDINKSQIKRMRQISSKFGDRVRVGFIQGEDVRLALTSTVMRSLVWPLLAIILTKQECKHITVPAISHVLSKPKFF